MAEIFSCERPDFVCPFCGARQKFIPIKNIGNRICDECSKEFEYYYKEIKLFTSKPIWMSTEQWDNKKSSVVKKED